MNPSSATALYLSTCRAALRCDPQQPESFMELYNLLPFFRDALSCLVCGNLLQDPVSPSGSTCQHFFCRGCREDTLKLKLKLTCGSCRNATAAQNFEENLQLQVLVNCYRSLCKFVWVTVMMERSAPRVGGYAEVMKMLEEALEVKEEQEEAGVDEQGPDISQEAPEGKAELRSLLETDSDVDQQGEDLLKDFKTELDLSRPVLSSAVDPEVAMEQFNSDAITINISNGSAAPVLLSVEEVLNSLEYGCSTKQEEPPQDIGSSAEPFPAFQSNPSGALPPALPQQPQTGITCQAAAHRKVHLSRKRSRSESDSETLQPLPIACLIQKPSVAATVPAQAAVEPKARSFPATVPNGAVLKVSRMLLDSTKNLQKHAESLGAKKVPAKTKLSTPKLKPKPKVSDRAPPGHSTKVVYKKPPEKKGCKCGRATQNPSVLTCRGQRCPCYSNRKACLDCICRGCQNSFMANGEKKLEAFAVPEKALEQTRLTLGINLTSISVMSAGTNTGVLSLSAGPTMSSFLSQSPEKEPSFEDRLEMRF